MATSDAELIDEVRSYTGYESTETFTDPEIKDVIDIAKEEITARLVNDQLSPPIDFYNPPSGWGERRRYNLRRALFWFSCIGVKVRAGEIGSVDLTISELEQQSSEGEFGHWFAQLQQRVAAAQAPAQRGMSSTQISRGDRTYSVPEPRE